MKYIGFIDERGRVTGFMSVESYEQLAKKNNRQRTVEFEGEGPDSKLLQIAQKAANQAGSAQKKVPFAYGKRDAPQSTFKVTAMNENQKILLAFIGDDDDGLVVMMDEDSAESDTSFEIGSHVRMKVDRWTSDRLFKRFGAGDIGIVKGDQPDMIAPAYHNSPRSTKRWILVELGGKLFKVLPEEVEPVPDESLIDKRQVEEPTDDEVDPFSDAFEGDDFAEEVDELLEDSDLETDNEGEIEDPEEAHDEADLEDIPPDDLEDEELPESEPEEDDVPEDAEEDEEEGKGLKKVLRFMK